MAGTTAIVAIPDPDDKVWKLSSEKVPHLTLMILGDQSQNPRLGHIESYLEHVVATSVSRFGMDVDHRGPLGPKDADVLFFGDYSKKKLEDIRSFLLKDPSIFMAYNSVEQFPEWTPHLTLGYPETPAHKDDSDYPGVHWVSFNRIALWVEDYDGPEFRLSQEHDTFFGHSETYESDKFLAHHGIKGMKWGVRRTDAQLGNRPKKIKTIDVVETQTGIRETIKVPRGVKSHVDENGKIRLTGRNKSAVEEAQKRVDEAHGKIEERRKQLVENDPEKPGHVSVDAERTMHTVGKDSTVEMSTREMKEAIDRANTVSNYKKMFENGETPLERQLKELQMQKQIRDLQREMTPQKRSRVDKLVSGAQKGWGAYSTVDKAMGGSLTKGLAKKLGVHDEPSALEKLLAENKGLKAQSENLDLKNKIARGAEGLAKAKKTTDKVKETAAATQDPRVQKEIASLFPATRKSDDRSLSPAESLGKRWGYEAKQSVQDAKDLNKILSDYLGPEPRHRKED